MFGRRVALSVNFKRRSRSKLKLCVAFGVGFWVEACLVE
jgi:hypothetical protein